MIYYLYCKQKYNKYYTITNCFIVNLYIKKKQLMKYLKLYENVKSHNQIITLSKLIITAIVNRTIKYKKWNDNDDMYENNSALMMYCILPVVLKDIDVRGKGFDINFRNFIKNKKKWFRISVDVKSSDSNVEGVYKRDNFVTYRQNKEIYLYYDKDDIENYFKKLDGDLKKINYYNLSEFLEKGRNSLIHELQHAYDDWNSNSKAFKPNRITPNKNDENKEKKYNTYLKSSHEISAFFTNTTDKVFNQKNINGYYHVYDPTKWEDAMKSFIELYPKWEILNDKIKKRLITRLYQIWDDKYGGNKKFNKKDITEKLKKLVVELRKEYDGEIYIYYYHDNNSIEIKTIKVNSIEIEKNIYKKIIRLADTYRKIITTNVYKGFTTSAIMKAKVYLKEFGFSNNKTNKRDYRFSDDYIRYSRR